MRDVLRIAGAYIAFCIGSGYATGQEILRFFTAFGRMGLGAAVIAMASYMWMGAVLLREGQALAAKADREIWAHYCGQRLGRVMDGFVALLCTSSYVIMIAGAGAVLEQQCGIPAWIGRVAMAAVCLATVLLGLESVTEILGAIGPAIIVFSLVIGVGGIMRQGSGAPAVEVPAACGDWALSGILYAAFMAPLCVPFLTRLAGTVPDPRRAGRGGALGGALLMLAVMVMSTALLRHLGETAGKPIPTLVLAQQLHPLLAGAFMGVILLGIYSTAAPQLWMLCRKAGPDGSTAFRLTAAAMTAVGLAGSVLPFAELVGAIYPAAGYIGLVPLICVLGRGIAKPRMRRRGRSAGDRGRSERTPA